MPMPTDSSPARRLANTERATRAEYESFKKAALAREMELREEAERLRGIVRDLSPVRVHSITISTGISVLISIHIHYSVTIEQEHRRISWATQTARSRWIWLRLR